MNTPAHIIFSLAAVGHVNAWSYPLAIVAGALAPDLGMVVFYAWHRLQGTPESAIWDTHYFDPAWQNFFDLANSIPLVVVGMLLCWWLGKKALLLFFASMGVHCLLDLLVHHDDGHRHFFPLSHWRFRSPVSYWDPQHHGALVGTAEFVLFVVGVIWLWRQPKPADLSAVVTSTRMRGLLLLTALIYGLYFWFVYVTWLNL